MEVKSIYLDLIEGKRNGNVWRLESEAFKDPIEIKICYDNHELKEFQTTCEALDKKIADHNREIEKLKDYDLGLEKGLDLHLQSLLDKEKRLQEQEKKIESAEKEMKSLYKEIADLKQMVEMQSGTILHLQEQMKQISQKLMEQPTVIRDKGFISGHEPAGLGMVELKDGNYLMVAKYVVGEHNEYVENKNDIVIEKIYVDGGHYIPFYKLEGGTALDLPTATIYYDLVFIPL